MTMEKAFYKAIKPFIEENLSFVVNDDDRGLGVSGPNKYSTIQKDGYNYELSRIVLGLRNDEMIEYRIHKTIVPYTMRCELVYNKNIFTQSCWVYLKNNKSLDINGYEKNSKRQNCCSLCILCDKKTEWCKSFSVKSHNATAKHKKNLITYNDNIKETLGKKNIGGDMVNEIMSYL